MSELPAPNLQTDVNDILRDVALAHGVSVDSLTTVDLEGAAYGVRISASEFGRDKRQLRLANALDELSTLDQTALEYLEKVASQPLAAAGS